MSDDLISRQVAIDAIYHHFTRMPIDDARVKAISEWRVSTMQNKSENILNEEQEEQKDLISRQAAIYAIKDLLDNMLETDTIGFYEIENVLFEVPSAQTERKNGEWKPFDLTWGRSVYSCTACGDAMDIPTEMGKPIYNFCPNCGARMGGDNETSD